MMLSLAGKGSRTTGTRCYRNIMRRLLQWPLRCHQSRVVAPEVVRGAGRMDKTLLLGWRRRYDRGISIEPSRGDTAGKFDTR